MENTSNILAINGVSLPTQVGTFVRGQVTDFESDHIGLGQSIDYKGTNGATATVYIYDHAMPHVPSSIEDPIVVNEFNRAISDVLQVYQGD